MCGDGLSAGGSPAWTGTLYGRPDVYPAVADTARAELWQRVFEAPPAPPDPYARVVAARPPHPASPADIYMYADAHSVIHFTNYRPTEAAPLSRTGC